VVIVAEATATADAYYYYSSTRVRRDEPAPEAPRSAPAEPSEEELFPDEPTAETPNVTPTGTPPSA